MLSAQALDFKPMVPFSFKTSQLLQITSVFTFHKFSFQQVSINDLFSKFSIMGRGQKGCGCLFLPIFTVKGRWKADTTAQPLGVGKAMNTRKRGQRNVN